MALLAVRMEQADLDDLKAKAEELRIPFTVLARSLIVQALKEKNTKNLGSR